MNNCQADNLKIKCAAARKQNLQAAALSSKENVWFTVLYKWKGFEIWIIKS